VLPLAGALRIETLDATALSVPLRDPFVIASARVDATRAAEVRLTVRWNGRLAEGLGEAACLPPVTREDQPDVLEAVARAGALLVGLEVEATGDAIAAALAGALPDRPVARAGVECALLDGLARAEGVPLRTLLDRERGGRTASLETDVTVPIGAPEAMAARAREWVSRGFSILKIKVGKDVDTDVRALEAVARAAPGARLRVDANAGYTDAEAIALANACERMGLAVELWEQPCAADDWEGLARVTAAVRAPVVADESVRHVDDVARIAKLRCARGVNLKLVKFGGALAAHAAGVAAQRAGLSVMVGGMVETRLGMASAAHVACALGGADYVDLDTAMLLADDPYEGGYVADGPRYVLPESPGIGVARPPVL
jgi:L-alanine-DL-glutamate epimerase-like enolase superfamily enzyme